MESIKRKIEIAVNLLNLEGSRLKKENASDLEISIVQDDFKELRNLSNELEEILSKIEKKTEEIARIYKPKNTIINK